MFMFPLKNLARKGLTQHYALLIDYYELFLQYVRPLDMYLRD